MALGLAKAERTHTTKGSGLPAPGLAAALIPFRGHSVESRRSSGLLRPLPKVVHDPRKTQRGRDAASAVRLLRSAASRQARLQQLSLSRWLIPERAPPAWRCLLITVGALALATAIRWLFPDAASDLFPTATYFPALLLVSAHAGWRWGVAAVAGAIALLYAFVAGAGQAPIGETVLLGLGLFAASGLVCVVAAASLRRSVIELRASRAAIAQAELSLLSHHQRLRLAEEAGGLGLWEWDLTTGEATVARSAGGGPRPLEAPNYLAYLSRVHPEDRPAMQAAGRAAIMDGRFFDQEYRLSTSAGERWIHSRGEVIRDEAGRAIRVLGYNFDVTERRLAEDRLRESEQRFRTLADSAPAPMWVTGLDRKRIFVNRAYTELMALPYEDALKADWRDILHPEDHDRIVAESIAGEASRQPFPLEARYRVYGRDEYRWIRSFSQPRFDPTGELAGFIGIAVDITDAKRAEADLVRLNDLLAERVQEALGERDQAQAALMQSQKLEAVGQLTGGVAHDFNNLLTVVIGALDIVARNPDDAARRVRLLDAALSAARRGERLTQQLLAFARRQPLKTERVVIDALIAGDEALFRRAVGEAVQLTFALSAGEAACHLDAGQLEAAVLNLVVNARDATPDGGHIRIETACETFAQPRGELAAGFHVRVTVADNGPGMSADTQARAFEPFFTTKAVGKGTGLGLSQVYGFARQSGGDVEIDSAPGRGARVSLVLPCAQVEAAAVSADDDLTPEPFADPLTVFLVEDDADVGDLIEAMLVELGHRVRRAETVDQALAGLTADARADVLLTDVIMPGGKSGVDLARTVAERWPDMPIILSSGYTGDNLASAEAAPWPLLRKPYTLQVLAAAIAEATER
jgi:PAS domain S-box-containing protein